VSARPFWLAFLWLAGNATLLELHVLAPRLRGPLFGEDRIVETATALLFLAAFAVGLAFLIAYRSRRYRVLLLIASSLGLLGFLDEISFGARLFGWSMPKMAGGGEFDGAHDFVILIYRVGAEADPIVIAAICATLVLTSLLGVRYWHAQILSLTHRMFTDPAYGLFALFVGGVGVAAILDLDIGFLRHLGPVEEIVELNAALALLLSVLWTNRPLRGTSGRTGTSGGSRPPFAGGPNDEAPAGSRFVQEPDPLSEFQRSRHGPGALNAPAHGLGWRRECPATGHAPCSHDLT
jgi:hypothetical protein